MANEPIKVGIAESKIGTSPASIITNGLGSCVGVCQWDPVSRIGGMVHVMLPDSTQSNSVLNKAKYADTGIVLLLSELCQRGVNKNRLVAKIAGGAQMFNFPGTSNLMRIGERNVEAVKNTLQYANIKIIAEDTGGNYGRTIEFFTENGQLLVRTIHKGVKVI
jgi:chemotaxis protein CheD